MRIHFLCCLLLVLLLPAMALGQEDAKAEAGKSFREGVEAFNDEKFEEASVAFKHAYELAPNWKLLFNIGQCEASLKRYGQALDFFERYMVEGGDEINQTRQDEVNKEIDRLERLVGELDVQGPEGAVLMVDGEERGLLPLPGTVRVTAGLRVVGVSMDGELQEEKQVKVTGRKKVSVAFSIPVVAAEAVEAVEPDAEEETAEEPVEPTPPAPAGPMKKAGIGLIAGGAVLLVASAITGSMALAKGAALEDACPDQQCTSQEDMDLRDQAVALKVTTDILWPIGAAAAATGLVFLIIDKKKGERADVAVSPVAGPGYGGIAVGGSF